MNKIIKDNQNGFTMIEILIATLVFAIGILGVAIMQISAIKGNSFASGLTEASTLAQDKMEELMMLDYNDLKLTDTDGDGTNMDGNNDGADDSGNNFGLLDPLFLPPGPAPPLHAADYQSPSGIYTIYYNIADNVPGTNTKTIGIVVTWGPQDEYVLVRRIAIQSIKAPM